MLRKPLWVSQNSPTPKPAWGLCLPGACPLLEAHGACALKADKPCPPDMAKCYLLLNMGGEMKSQGGGDCHAPSTRVFLGADFVPRGAECLDFVPVAFCTLLC